MWAVSTVIFGGGARKGPDHPLSTYAKYSQNFPHQAVRNVSFSEHFAYVLNG